MPNTHVLGAAEAMSAACIRLQFAILLIRTAKRLSDRAEVIIRHYERRAR